MLVLPDGASTPSGRATRSCATRRRQAGGRDKCAVQARRCNVGSATRARRHGSDEQTMAGARNLHPQTEFLGCTAVVLAVGGFGGWGSTTEIAGAVIANGHRRGREQCQEGAAPDRRHRRRDPGQGRQRSRSRSGADTARRHLDAADLGVIKSQLDLYVAREARLLAERDGLTAFDSGRVPEGVYKGDGRAAIAGERGCSSRAARDTTANARNCANGSPRSARKSAASTAQQQSKDREIGYIGEELSAGRSSTRRTGIDRALKQLQRDKARL